MVAAHQIGWLPSHCYFYILYFVFMYFVFLYFVFLYFVFLYFVFLYIHVLYFHIYIFFRTCSAAQLWSIILSVAPSHLPIWSLCSIGRQFQFKSRQCPIAADNLTLLYLSSVMSSATPRRVVDNRTPLTDRWPIGQVLSSTGHLLGKTLQCLLFQVQNSQSLNATMYSWMTGEKRKTMKSVILFSEI